MLAGQNWMNWLHRWLSRRTYKVLEVIRISNDVPGMPDGQAI